MESWCEPEKKGKQQLHTFRKQLLSLARCAVYCIYIISLIHTECKYNLCFFRRVWYGGCRCRCCCFPLHSQLQCEMLKGVNRNPYGIDAQFIDRKELKKMNERFDSCGLAVTLMQWLFIQSMEWPSLSKPAHNTAKKKKNNNRVKMLARARILCANVIKINNVLPTKPPDKKNAGCGKRQQQFS